MFIEIMSAYGTVVAVNVLNISHITPVQNSAWIYTRHAMDNQQIIACRESYEEVMEKIRQAQMVRS